MSREAPRFGDVFRWKSETQNTMVMFIASVTTTRPTTSFLYPGDDWWGVALDDDLVIAGDVDIRIALDYKGWSEVTDE